jgi:hypothetical protein
LIFEVVTALAAIVVANAPEVVMSPDRSPFVIDVAPENFVSSPVAGEPVVVTVPPPPLDPLAAAVMRPFASTVRLVLV